MRLDIGGYVGGGIIEGFFGRDVDFGFYFEWNENLLENFEVRYGVI